MERNPGTMDIVFRTRRTRNALRAVNPEEPLVYGFINYGS